MATARHAERHTDTESEFSLQIAEHGVFARSAQASSALLPEFEVSVDEVFDAD